MNENAYKALKVCFVPMLGSLNSIIIFGLLREVRIHDCWGDEICFVRGNLYVPLWNVLKLMRSSVLELKL